MNNDYHMFEISYEAGKVLKSRAKKDPEGRYINCECGKKARVRAWGLCRDCAVREFYSEMVRILTERNLFFIPEVVKNYAEAHLAHFRGFKSN